MDFSWEKAGDLAMKSISYVNKQFLDNFKRTVKIMDDDRLLKSYNKALSENQNISIIEIFENEIRRRGL